MIDYSKLLNLLVPIFRPVVALGEPNYPLVQAPFNSKSPPVGYSTIQLLQVLSVGQMEEGCIDEVSGMQVKQHQNLTIRVQTFGKNAYTRAVKLAVSLEFPSMTDKLDAVGVCWRSTTTVSNISSMVTSKYEERATFDMRLGTSWGDLDQEALDPETEGNPSTGAFDDEVVPVNSAQVDIYVDDTPSTTGDERLINSTLIQKP